MSVHASHEPVHGVSQQTPSAQCPDPHSVSVLHVALSGLAQTPVPLASQRNPAAQLALEQQTPSTQWLLRQSLPKPHALPSAPLVLQVELVMSQ